jgi:hypothetical protein
MLALVTLVGTAVGHFLGGPDSWDRTVLGLSTSARHPAVAIAITSSAIEENRLALLNFEVSTLPDTDRNTLSNNPD